MKTLLSCCLETHGFDDVFIFCCYLFSETECVHMWYFILIVCITEIVFPQSNHDIVANPILTQPSLIHLTSWTDGKRMQVTCVQNLCIDNTAKRVWTHLSRRQHGFDPCLTHWKWCPLQYQICLSYQLQKKKKKLKHLVRIQN